MEDKPVFVLGLNVVDTPESATLGAIDVYNFLQLVWSCKIVLTESA